MVGTSKVRTRVRVIVIFAVIAYFERLISLIDISVGSRFSEIVCISHSKTQTHTDIYIYTSYARACLCVVLIYFFII